MKPNLPFLAGTFLAGCLAFSAGAQPQPIAPTGAADVLGAEKTMDKLNDIEIRNFKDERLGRISDIGIDLANGRIVEVLVVSNQFLGMGGKTVAVPPGALYPDGGKGVYRLNIGREEFKQAPAINLKKWSDAGRSDLVAAAYRFFGQEPYFLEEGDTATQTAARPKVPLGYVERSSKLLNMSVGNLQGQKFGSIYDIVYNIPGARVRSVIVLSPDAHATKSVIPPTALSFNAARDALLLDNTKKEFEDEPRIIYFASPDGSQQQIVQQEAYKGPRTTVALEQGSSYRDVDRTVLINKNIRAAKINDRNVQVGTLNGRVTVRGWVVSNDDKRRINEIAIAASQLELVDNQLTVGRPAAK
jgi:sporulation protein YlmC with PRC-barrel domain